MNYLVNASSLEISSLWRRRFCFFLIVFSTMCILLALILTLSKKNAMWGSSIVDIISWGDYLIPIEWKPSWWGRLVSVLPAIFGLSLLLGLIWKFYRGKNWARWVLFFSFILLFFFFVFLWVNSLLDLQQLMTYGKWQGFLNIFPLSNSLLSNFFLLWLGFVSICFLFFYSKISQENSIYKAAILMSGVLMGLALLAVAGHHIVLTEPLNVEPFLGKAYRIEIAALQFNWFGFPDSAVSAGNDNGGLLDIGIRAYGFAAWRLFAWTLLILSILWLFGIFMALFSRSLSIQWTRTVGTLLAAFFGFLGLWLLVDIEIEIYDFMFKSEPFLLYLESALLYAVLGSGFFLLLAVLSYWLTDAVIRGLGHQSQELV